MNKLLKSIIMLWLTVCGLFLWIGCAILGFFATFVGNLAWMYNVTPFIGLTSLICIILVMVRVYKSNPADYIANLIRGYIGKAKI